MLFHVVAGYYRSFFVSVFAGAEVKKNSKPAPLKTKGAAPGQNPPGKIGKSSWTAHHSPQIYISQTTGQSIEKEYNAAPLKLARES
jgi:hypothetical protein